VNKLITPPRAHRSLPITILIDADATATVISIDPDAFSIPKRQIAREIAALISNWIVEQAA
jgi:hypothetical protein